MAPETHFAYVGSRTTRERGASGDGICVFAVDRSASLWRPVQTVGGLVNPSFLAFSATGQHLYVVHGDTSHASAFAVDARSGLLSFINRTECGGQNPVHLAIHPQGRFLVVANHLSSNLASLAIAADGSLGPIVDVLALPGEPGPHRNEQPFAKPHHLVFDRSGRFLLAPDKGLDLTLVVSVDAETGKLALVEGQARDREGSGPRHLAFSPDNRFAYVVNELDSTVSALAFDAEAGHLEPLQRISTLPDSFFGFSRAAEIVLAADGSTLYASNRGHDSIASFAVDSRTGGLSVIDWQSCGGRTPRFFCPSPDGSAIVCANEESHALTHLDGVRRQILAEPRVVAEVRSPVCIVWREREAPDLQA